MTIHPEDANNISMTTQKPKITLTSDDILSIPQAAKELGVHFTTVYRWIDKGIIRPFRIGGQVFITVDDLKALKKERVNE